MLRPQSGLDCGRRLKEGWKEGSNILVDVGRRGRSEEGGDRRLKTGKVIQHKFSF